MLKKIVVGGLTVVIVGVIVAGTVFGIQEKNKKEKYETTIETENPTEKETFTTEEAPNRKIEFPKKYETTIGKVNFNCKVEVPEKFNATEYYQWRPDDAESPKIDTLLEGPLKNKELSDREYDREIVRDMPEGEKWLAYKDYSTVHTGKGFLSYHLSGAEYYYSVYDFLDQYDQENCQEKLSFSTPEQAISDVRELLNQMGYSYDVELYSAAVTGEMLKIWEKQRESDGLMEHSEKKPEWGEEDDAYIVYGYQRLQGLDVCNEMHLLGGELSRMNVLNASIHAVITKEGVISMDVYNMYDFSEKKDPCEFAAFDQIAAVAGDKYNEILEEASYDISLARLCMLVQYNQEQEREAIPVWYLEGMKPGENIQDEKIKFSMFVDAVSCREVITG